MEKEFILAFDQGTTSSRTILLDQDLKMIAMEQMELPQYYPAKGWVEQDPLEIWSTQLKSARKLFKNHPGFNEKVFAAGITNQRETVLAWNRKTGKPYYNAIVWQDKRTSIYCDQLKNEGREKIIYEKTGLVIDSYFSATKIKWMLDNVEGLREEAECGNVCFGNVDSWLLFKFTNGGVFATDYTNASRTMLFNLNSFEWDPDLLSMFNIPLHCLPEIKSSTAQFGLISHIYFGNSIPVTGIAGDQQAALFGQGCFEPGTAKNTYGTGCFILMNTGEKLIKTDSGLLSTIAWNIEGETTFALEGSIFIAGAAIKWLRDALKLIKTASETEEIAFSLNDSEGVYVVPSFTGLGAPYWDQYARGAIFGLTHRVTNKHIVRATLESIAFQTRDIIEIMKIESKIELKELKADGGAAANDFLMQFQSDILGVDVERPENIETTALGAAYLAAIGAGMKNIEEIRNIKKEKRIFKPSENKYMSGELYKGWKEALERVRNWKKDISAK